MAWVIAIICFPRCPHLGTIIAGSTIVSTGTSRTWGTLYTTLARETSLALQRKERAHDGCSNGAELGTS